MSKCWICLMASRTLPHDDLKNIQRELSMVFGDDLLGYKVVCNDLICSTGEYYLFVHCNNYWDHIESIAKRHFITGVVPSREDPYKFSLREIADFVSSAGYKGDSDSCLQMGDVVLVKDGYLKGLYGIVIKVLPSKRLKVFFSFYVRQFSEALKITDLEFIGRIDGYEFPAEVSGKPIVIGAHVVHHRKLYRSGRKLKNSK